MKDALMSFLGGVRRLDEFASSLIESTNHHYFSAILLAPAMAFGQFFMWLTILLSWWAVGFSNWELLELVTGSLATLAVTTIGKKYIQRPRPSRSVDKLVNVRSLETNHSFPSGDAAQAFCMWAFFMAIKNRPAADKVLWVAIIAAVSRVYFACHYVSDVVAGFLCGSTAMWIVHLAVWPCLPIHPE
jgi:undecaprenyl-diphosphatase